MRAYNCLTQLQVILFDGEQNARGASHLSGAGRAHACGLCTYSEGYHVTTPDSLPAIVRTLLLTPAFFPTHHPNPPAGGILQATCQRTRRLGYPTISRKEADRYPPQHQLDIFRRTRIGFTVPPRPGDGEVGLRRPALKMLTRGGRHPFGQAAMLPQSADCCKVHSSNVPEVISC